MSVELIRAPEPAIVDTDSDASDSHSDSDREDVEDDPAVRALLGKVAKMSSQCETLQWDIGTADDCVSAWKAYGNTLCGFRAGKDSPEPGEPVLISTIESFTENFAVARSAAGKRRRSLADATQELEAGQKELAKCRLKAERRIEKQRHNKLVRRQRKKASDAPTTYPYYRLKVTVEADTLPPDAPSIAAEVDPGRPKQPDDGAPPLDAAGPSLRISYLVAKAGWSPKFELRIDTTARSGVLSFRAEITNTTGELWREAAVTLSTVETRYSGVFECIPRLRPWKITAGTKDAQTDARSGYSVSEWSQKTASLFTLRAAAAPNSNPFATPATRFTSAGGLFGSVQPATSFGGNSEIPNPGQLASFGSAAKKPTVGGTPPGTFAASRTRGGGGHTTETLSLSASHPPPAPPAPYNPPSGFFGGVAASGLNPPAFGALPSQDAPPAPPATPCKKKKGRRPGTSHSPTPPDSPSDSTPALPFVADAKMALATSTANIYGITTTFSLPGKKTLPSSPTPLRFMVSETALHDIELAYTCVPKLRTAAFLAATFSLPPAAPPLPERSLASLSVDGTFLGSLQLPKKDDDDKLVVPLGADEGIEVTYALPKCRSETKGILRKEETVTFSRAFSIRNRKARDIVVVVRDQVPVVDDDKPVKLVVKKPHDADVQEDGTVEWTFEMPPGELQKGELEWDVIVEGGEGIVSLT